MVGEVCADIAERVSKGKVESYKSSPLLKKQPEPVEYSRPSPRTASLWVEQIHAAGRGTFSNLDPVARVLGT